MDFDFVFVIMIAIGPKTSIPVDMDNLCHEDMTREKGGGRMLQDEWYLGVIYKTSPILVIFSGKILHYLIPMMLSVLLKAIEAGVSESYDIQHSYISISIHWFSSGLCTDPQVNIFSYYYEYCKTINIKHIWFLMEFVIDILYEMKCFILLSRV